MVFVKGPRLARRVVWLVPWVVLLGLSLATPPPDGAKGAGRPSTSVEASARDGSPDPAAADSGTNVAAQAGDRLAQAFIALDAAGGYVLRESVGQTFDGTPAPTAQMNIVYDARGEGDPILEAWGTAAVSDDPQATAVRIFARGSSLHYDSGDGWDAIPYTGPADVYGAFGAYDEWDWLADAYQAGKVTLGGDAGGLAGGGGDAGGTAGDATAEPGTYVLTIDPDWLAARLADEGLALAPQRAAYRVAVRDAANGPELDVRGEVTLSMGEDTIETRCEITVRSILGLPAAQPPADLAAGSSQGG